MTIHMEEDSRNVLRNTGYVFLFCSLFIIFIMLMGALFGSSGRIDYCYIDGKDYPVVLYGHRNWRRDIVIGKYSSEKLAVSMGRTLGCALSWDGHTTDTMQNKQDQQP